MAGIWKRISGEVRPFVKPVLIVFGIILLGMVAILRANFSYVDDLGRAAVGYKGWGNFSRYLSNFLAMVLHGSGFLTDISPWGQIVAALIMAISGVMLLYIVYGRKKLRWWELFVVAILALNPYFLQCLSYKFDAPFIAIAVLAMVAPTLAGGLAMKGKGWLYAGVVLVGTLVTCMTYQAALGILPMVTILVAVRMWNKGESLKRVGKFVGWAVVGYGVGLLIFKVFIMKLVNDYVVTEVPGLMAIIPHTLGNLEQYYRLVVADFAKTWLVLIAAVVVWFVIVMIVDAKRRKWLAGIIGVVTVLALGVVCFGIYVLMEKPLFEPRAMFGVGVMICLIMVVVVEERKLGDWRRYVYGGGVVVAVVLAYLLGIFGFTYGNALAVQKDYADFRIEAVLNDLERTVKEGDTVEVVGTVGLAPAMLNAVEQYPILGRLVPIEFEEGYWGQYKIMKYYGISELQGELFIPPVAEEYPIVEEHWYHNLRGEEGKIVVELKERR